ncbi:271_t:CDS:2 [Diversispora eburnea]|uniref:Late endosomal/lysosomal adaptor and MAPK and MTOR activator 5 n=1 Tax=Diversispora eburnea TaxID=1213867 RepID=A0A9N8VNZ3_9GLOM|nr:271_t:CDS:2 [Diversispora eburnea]
METAVISVLESLIKTDGVKGVLIADEHGLCLGALGTANPNCSGIIREIATHAKSLNEDSNSQQLFTIKIEANNS